MKQVIRSIQSHAANFIALPLAWLFSNPVYALDEINVAYFLEWATPNLIAKAEKTYDQALGATVNWKSFDSGTLMTEAMLSGEIDIAYSQGLVPFLTAINSGAPLVTVGVAVEYPATPCFVAQSNGINTENASDLEGLSVALPLNTMADYSFRMQMDTLNVDTSTINVIDQLPADAAASLRNGQVSMVCLWGGDTINSLKHHGKALMSEEVLVDSGIISFDLVTVTQRFARENPDAVETFMSVTDSVNKAFARSQEKIDLIAAESGLDIDTVRNQMASMIFPTVEDQLIIYFNKSGLADETIDMVGNVFSTLKAPARNSYDVVIDTSFLK